MKDQVEKRQEWRENKKCCRYDCNGWNYVHVEGDPKTRGRAHGFLMAEEIKGALEEAKKLIFLQTGMEWSFFREDERSVVFFWEESIRSKPYEEYYEELSAVAAGVKERLDYVLDLKDLLIWNGYEELTNYWFPTVAAEVYNSLQGPSAEAGSTHKEFNSGAPDRCSAFIATGNYTKDGGIVAAHNTFTPFENSNFSNVVIEIVPTDGNPFIMQSQPGRPVPFEPRGAVDGVAVSAQEALKRSFFARWGSSCGMAFDADSFLAEHPQFEYLREFLKDRPSRPWTVFPAED